MYPQMIMPQHPHGHAPGHAPYHYMYPAQLVPMTPVDFPYTPMLPSNLLATPSPYMGHATFLALQPPLPRHSSHASRGFPVYATPAYSSPVIGPPPFLRAHSLPVLPYVAQHHPHLTSMEQLKLSRTVMLRYINKDVSITDLLNEIDVGPIEYCKMFTTPCPNWLKLQEEFKSCSISFVNTQISVIFVLRYAKNQSNLRLLKERLKGSQHLQISLNESLGNSLNNQDLIKVKTLNYIQERNATRAVSFRVVFVKPDGLELSDEENAVTAAVKTAVQDKCSRFGEVEHSEITATSSSVEFDASVHFTAIDSSIKAYEAIKKQLGEDANGLVVDGARLCFTSVAFAKDRCDRVDITSESARRKSAASSNLMSSLSLANVSALKKRLSRSRSQSEEVQDDEVDTTESVDSPHSSSHSHNGHAHTGHNGRHPSLKPINTKGLSSVSEAFEPYQPGQVSLDPYQPEDDLVSVSSSNSDGLLNLIHDNMHDPFTKNTSYLYLAQLAASFSSLNYDPSTHPSSSSGGANLVVPPVPGVLAPMTNSGGVDLANVQNRTLFLGNLHPNTTIEEIANNVRAGGLVEWIKSYPAKHICFITFVDPAVALKFYMMHQVYHQLVIHGNEVCVKWGKNHLGPLSRDIALAVTAGASRNVYIGYKKGKDRAGNVILPNEDELRRDFAQFGELEQVNIYHKRNCGFVNFLNIADAIDLVDSFKAGDREKLAHRIGDAGQFYDKYSYFNISFGKDRCGNPLKFSFKKREPKAVNEALDVGDTEDAEEKESSPDRMNSFSQEAAMVFGILTDNVDPEPLPLLEAGTEGAEGEANEKKGKKELGADSKPVAQKIGKYEKHYVNPETECFAEAMLSVAASKELSSDINSDSDSDSAVDDDIAIIIGTGSPKTQRPRKPARHDKIYYNRGTYFDDAVDPLYAIPMYGQFAHQPDYRHMGYIQAGMPYGPGDRMFNRAYSADFKPAFAQRAYSSGSQVMADYLAKLSQDHMLFTPMHPGPEGDRRRSKRPSKAAIDRE